MNIASKTTEVSFSQKVFSTFAALLEERKTLGDRRRLPDSNNPFSHPFTNRRSGYERREGVLNEEVFNRSSQD